MAYFHSQRPVIMSPTKSCDRCEQRFRGTTSNESWCAKCEVKYCTVNEDTDQEFVKLATQIHGSSLLPVLPLDDLMNHKARMQRLENELEGSRKSTKEKNRIKREIFRLREERKAMEELMESIKTRMMQVALVKSFSNKVPSSPSMPSPRRPSAKSTPSTSPAKSFADSKTQRSPTQVKSFTLPKSTPAPVQVQQQLEQPQSLPSSFSPVKSTAAKFEEAAKKVTTVVTFAKTPKRPEVNNNDTPVTASSSSDEEGDEMGNNQVFLTRSNSVRDRVKAFEEIQRRASTGSCDRRPGLRHLAKNNQSLNV